MPNYLILTLLAYDDTAYYTQFSLKAELQLKNKLLLMGGWVGLLEKWRIRLSSASAGFELGFWVSLAILKSFQAEHLKLKTCFIFSNFQILEILS